MMQIILSVSGVFWYLKYSERLPPLLHTSTTLVAVRGTKIVFRLLPRLQHWQHDMAIHSQYCISLAFCEHTSANLRPQSALLSIFEGCGDGLRWWGGRGGIFPSHSAHLTKTHTDTHTPLYSSWLITQ